MENKNPLEWRTETREEEKKVWDFISEKMRGALEDLSAWRMEENVRQTIKDAASIPGIASDRIKVDTSQINRPTEEAAISIEEAEEKLRNMKTWIDIAWSLNLTWQMSRTDLGRFIFEYYRVGKTQKEIAKQNRWSIETAKSWKETYLSFAVILAADAGILQRELSKWKRVPVLILPDDIYQFTEKRTIEAFAAIKAANEEKKKKIDYIGNISAPPTDRTKVQTPPAAPVEKKAIKIADEKAKREQKEKWVEIVKRVNKIFKGTTELAVAVKMFGRGKTQKQITEELKCDRQKVRYHKDRYITYVAIFAANEGLLRDQLKAFWDRTKQDGEWFGSESDCHVFSDDNISE